MKPIHTLYLFFSLLILTAALAMPGCSCGGDDDDDDDDDDDQEGDDDVADDDDSSDSLNCDEEICTDDAKGLMWQREANTSKIDWFAAEEDCEGLDLAGYDDWRLPTITELETLILGCALTGSGSDCPISDECNAYHDCWTTDCDYCKYDLGPGLEGCYWSDYFQDKCRIYWSSTLVPDWEDNAWHVSFDLAQIWMTERDDYDNYHRCVRSK